MASNKAQAHENVFFGRTQQNQKIGKDYGVFFANKLSMKLI